MQRERDTGDSPRFADVTQAQLQIVTALAQTEHSCTIPILLSLMSSGNLIFETRPDDVLAAQKFVSNMLVQVFGLHCQRVRVRSSVSRRDFVRSLFTAPPPAGRARTRPVRKRTQPNSPPTSPRRQPSDQGSPFGGYFPGDDEDSTSAAYDTGPLRSPSHQHLASSSQWERGISTAYDGGPVPASPMSGTTIAGSTTAYFDHAPAPRLPNAIVVTGLENAGSIVHHTLSEILRTRTVVLEDDPAAQPGSPTTRSKSPLPGASGSTWILPEPFIVIYVCPFDDRERPQISKGLLDRFAFSGNLDVYHRPQSPSMRKATLSREDILAFRTLAAQVRIQPHLESLLSALLTAARHHPKLDGSLLSLQTTRDLSALIRAHRIAMGKRMSWVERSRDREDRAYDVLDATVDDAVAMFRHTVVHRLRSRDGPSEHLLGGMLCGAVLDIDLEADMGKRETVRPGIREVVMEIQKAVAT
ncbi:hypothetical protein BKA62DRAFT_764092 [Auriculariales sp. MPI-PUGE-AT-0066]|nr:hypothetical protein BKA62DRAFT_764092 [Auriculariales sp. MPI-PUGE-AT-0066]